MALFEHWDVRDGLEGFTDLLRWCPDRQPATAGALVCLAGGELAYGDRRDRADPGQRRRSPYIGEADADLYTIDAGPYRSAPGDPSWGLNVDLQSSGLRVTDAAWDLAGFLACEDQVSVRPGPGRELWERAGSVRRGQTALRDVQ